ncbi:MAG: ATP-dependent RecD-like DNA helicase [Ruminococcaceae bacterium]|nr:ATP-dependent RecD-like DNA helicase [Oscillospiraceae bacterium]
MVALKNNEESYMYNQTSEHGGSLERIEGTVENVIYYNQDNGYTICDMALSDDEIITAVGIMPMTGEGDKLTVYGRWMHNPKYGRQFAVEQYERVMPSDVASILKYLSSRTIKGIGPKTAQRIVEEFGADTFDVIENHPEWLANVKGVSMKLALSASESFKEQSQVRSAMMFFRDYFGVATTLKIYQRWGGRSVDIAKQNPYRLCNEIDGIGFEKADSIAHNLGFEVNNFDRIMSGINYVLMKNGVINGHICLPREKLIPSAAALLGTDENETERAVDELLREGKLILRKSDGGDMIYHRETYSNEKYIAEKLCLIDKMCAAVDVVDIDRFIISEEHKSGIEYADLQKKAISDALRYGVLVLTGGPGTGKTTVVRALIHIFDNMGYDIALAAPTGRAAKRMSEATSMEAKTIHRLLEMTYDKADSFVFMRNENNHLDEHIIIVDEASMIDSALMGALLRAIKPGAKLIIIGDSDQLPSVGAGNVLCDIINSERFATVRLTEIFRQAQRSLIVTNAHAVNSGKMPVLSVKDNDFFYMPRATDRDIASTICELCVKRLPRTYGDMARFGTQIIAPSRKGEAGTENLNILLQSWLNPPHVSKREHTFRDKVFREGDKIMQIRNNYDLIWTRDLDDKTGNGIFNGDIGIIEEINKPESYMTILFDDRRVQYEFSLLEDLEHAYAITVHKSQGSEYPIVIIPMCSAAPMLLTRNLLYTAITRAQTMVILVGREDIVSQMVENNRQSMRYTGLEEILRETSWQ